MSTVYKLQMSAIRRLEDFIVKLNNAEPMIASLPSRVDRQRFDAVLVEAMGILRDVSERIIPTGRLRGEIVSLGDETHYTLSISEVLRLQHDIDHVIHMYRAALSFEDPKPKKTFKRPYTGKVDQ